MAEVRRYDPELAVSEAFKGYLDAALSEALRQISPVVTFYDPMAQDKAHRVVVLVHECTTKPNTKTAWDAVVEVTVKSRTQQATLKKDMADHFDRSNEVREALFRDELTAGLDAVKPGLGIDHVSTEIHLATEVRDGWVYSEARFEVSCYARAVTA